MRTRLGIVSLSLMLGGTGAGILVATDAASAYWTAPSAANGRGAAAATGVNAGARPAATASGSAVTVSWAASTLVTGQPVDGYILRRYDAQTLAPNAIGSACSDTIATTTCTEVDVPDGSWVYTVTPTVGASWRGTESTPSAALALDATPPDSSLSLTSLSGSATLVGSTVFYQGSSAGSFRVTNTVSDAGSGPASSRTTPLGDISTGWTHTPSTASTPVGGPYVSTPFSWTAGTSSSPTEAITTIDFAGNEVTTNLTFVNDTNPPSGTIYYADGFSSGRSIAITYSTGSPTDTAQLQRSRASLKAGACGPFAGFTAIGPPNPVSPYQDGPSTAGACYRYRLMVTDAVNNTAVITSPAVARLGYTGAIRATPGLLSYWRFGENAATSTDSFTGTTGVALQDRDGEAGATWARHSSAGADAVLTNSGRLRKDAASTTALYFGSGTPTSPDYRVTSEIYAATTLANDRAGVVARLDPTANTYYAAAYSNATASWTLSAVLAGTITPLGTATQPFPPGSTRRVALDIVGSTLRVLVDGTPLITVTDASISAAGRAGLLTGSTTVTTVTDTTGMHLDNYLVGPVDSVPASADTQGTNPGLYVNGPVLAQAGALASDNDTAARFDGLNDHMQVPTPTGLPTGAAARSFEMWFRTTSSARQVLYSYGNPSTAAQFALWLNPGATSMTAWGYGPGNDHSFPLATAVNDGAWHQSVTTYDGTSLTLYLDGVLISTQNATRATTLDSSGLVIGAIITPGDTNSGGYFNGVLDEVASYTTALGAATVADHYSLASPYQDVDGPTGGSVDGSNLLGTGARYRNTTSLTLALTQGTDPSGIASTGASLQRATATLSTDTCGAFGAYTTTATDPAASRSETVATSTCYRYRYVVADTLGNTTTIPSPTIKVDTSAPGTPASPTYSALTNTYGTGAVVYYRSTATSGSLTMTTSGSDTGSGLAGFTFPTLGTGWTNTPGATTATTAARTYSWSATGPTAPGARTITATNNAALTSTGRTITFTDDTSPPTGGALSYTAGRVTTTSTPLTLTLGTDTGSGIATTKSIQASTAPASAGTCGTFGAFTQVATTTSTAASVTSNAALALDTCYRFRYVVTDRVGNTTTYTNPNTVRRAAVYATIVTSTSGVADYWRLGEATGAISATDTIGANNNGTYQAAPTLGVTGALNGDTNTAATFDGTSQYVTATRNLSTNFSIELWFRSTQASGGVGPHWTDGAALLDADVSGIANDFGIGLQADGKVVAGIGTAGGADISITSAPGLNDGQWHHVVFTRTQTTGAITLHIDGTQAATGTAGTAALTASPNVNIARATSGGRHFQGTLDEIATYTSVLTPTQIAARHNAAR